MPCFKGLAVSIHTPDGPLTEFSIQKQSRASRISSYIPVPPARVPPGSTTGKPEQSTFAISITLLTPGLNVPYSTPKPTPEDPHPRPRSVGGLLGYGAERGRYGTTVPPYIPRTTDPNETIAAYIYFDGRVKEEVATLLRRGEETWVNSRWVSVPESEGGGLAEREFLFREVGLERWLNGLDLEGSKDKAARIERRQRRLEKKRQKRKDQQLNSDDEEEDVTKFSKRVDRGVLRYGGSNGSPVEDVPIEENLLSSDSDSDDDPPEPEAAGQIKVALFRVLASGEIKRGEYSPQFDAHDDDENGEQNGNGDSGDGDIDHTTSFAKPKALDPKSISTQTVTGIDPPEAPYAVFTFFYRGEKQLAKMGILHQPETPESPQQSRRKSSGPDFAKLGPLSSYGTVGFSGYRDPSKAKAKSQSKHPDAMDSDNEDDDDDRRPNAADDDDNETKLENGAGFLSPEDAKRQGEIADGVQKIKLKRQHSAEPLNHPASLRKSPQIKSTEDSPPVGTPQSGNSLTANIGTPPEGGPSPLASQDASDLISSPFKRHRPSISGLNSNLLGQAAAAAKELHAASGLPPSIPEATSAKPQDRPDIKVESDEEL